MTFHLRCLVLSMVVLSLCAAPSAVRADDGKALVGEYIILGWSPGMDVNGPPDYEGEASLRPWGDVLSYRGFMDGMTFAGAGIYDEDAKTLSLSFTNVEGSERGVTLLRVGDGILQGVWVMDNGGDGRVGRETWTRK